MEPTSSKEAKDFSSESGIVFYVLAFIVFVWILMQPSALGGGFGSQIFVVFLVFPLLIIGLILTSAGRRKKRQAEMEALTGETVQPKILDKNMNNWYALIPVLVIVGIWILIQYKGW